MGDDRAASPWVTAFGCVLALAAAVLAGYGAWYLTGALSADNRTNPLRELGVAIGMGALVTGAPPCLAGLALVVRGVRRRRAPVRHRH
ncbi:hypothetical protein [Terrabacter sp. NPDC000476]|uniref:hypothetical protein n=1 Tax=Terrabacter sp. NPDC000476 TaxID=3154258 RepID=UPI003318AEE5